MAGSINKKETSMIRDMTTGSVPKLLFVFAAPLLLSNALQAIYNIVDMIVVGQVIGGAGMSAVSTGGNILHILTFLSIGFGGAGQVIISRQVGSDNTDRVSKTVGTMFSMLMGMSVVMALLCYILRNQILTLVNTPAEAYDFTMDYTVTCICGLPFIYGYNTVSSVLRGMGDSKRPFMFIAIAAVMNTILDIVFVAFMHMEVFGAALATVIGQGFSFVFSVIYLYRRRESFGFDFKPKSFIPDRAVMQRISSLGVPMAIQSAAVSISMTVVNAWVNSFGVTYSAIAGIVSKLGMIIGIMSNAISTASGSMVGQNLGAREYGRVKEILAWATGAAVILSAIASLILARWPMPIFRMFTSDETVVAGAMIIISPMIINFFGAAGRTFGFGLINGSGNSRLNLLVALLDGIIVRIGAAYLLGFAFNMGPLGFWYGDAIAGFMPLLIGGVFFISGKWKRFDSV